jgi:hypothetical protein
LEPNNHTLEADVELVRQAEVLTAGALIAQALTRAEAIFCFVVLACPNNRLRSLTAAALELD